MLDQSFSAENFRRIIDLENRKGIHVEDKLSMVSIKHINENIKQINASIKAAKKIKDSDALKVLYDLKKQKRDQKEIQLQRDLETVSQVVSSKQFKISLNKVLIPGSKPIYTTDNVPEYYFTLKQLQRNISKLFGIKQASRFSIVEQVKTLLDNKFPKFVIRTDIKDFYENIEHKRLLDLLNKDNLLSPFSRNILRSILNDYKAKASTNKGVPRGIGISAYLAELFMRDIDKDIKDLQGITYYARYVDDIIIIFTPSQLDFRRDYLNDIKEIVELKYNLSLNPIKTKTFDLVSRSKPCELEYLGYKFFFGDNHLETRLTEKKVDNYKRRLKLAFDHYQNFSKINEKEARKILVTRLRFLTSNTRLMNNKENILVGIYYSNCHLTLKDDLKRLDNSLLQNVRLKITNQNLINRLSKYSFEKGFSEKKFSPFSTHQLVEIMTIWNKNNWK